MSFKKGVSYIFASQIVGLILGFFSSIFLSRILGPEGRGMNAIFTNALSFSILFFGFSINSTIIYFVNSKKVELNRLITSLAAFCVLSTLAVSVVLLILYSIGHLSLALPTGYESYSFILLFAAFHFVSLLISILTTILSAFKKFKIQSFLSLIPIVLSLSIYIIIFFGTSLSSSSNGFSLILAVTALGLLVNAIITLVFFKKEIDFAPVLNFIGWDEIKLLVSFTGMAFLANVFQFLSYKLDYWFVDSYSGTGQLGLYSLASQLAQLMWLLPNAIATVAYVEFSEEKAELPENILFLIKLIFYFSLPIYLVSVILAKFFIPILYGQNFAEVGNLFPIILIGVLLLNHAFVITGVNAGKGRFKMNFLGSFLGIVLSIFLYPIFISKWSIFGGLAASTIIYSVQSVYYTFSFLKVENLSFWQVFSVNKSDFARIKSLLLNLRAN